MLSGGGHAGGQDPAGAAQRLPGAAVTALVLVLLCVALRADVFGYADRTPQAEDAARARVYCLDTSFTLEDPRSLETLVKAQAELAENRAADVNCRMTFVVHYVLKDGTLQWPGATGWR
ncbi:MAG: hypothetical protein ACLU38_16115 [Dysosmobacter sp.]